MQMRLARLARINDRIVAGNLAGETGEAECAYFVRAGRLLLAGLQPLTDIEIVRDIGLAPKALRQDRG
jgi:hypothetical protein